MTNNLIDKQMEEFEKLWHRYDDNGKYAVGYNNLKSFLRDFYLEIIESIGEEVEGMKQKEHITLIIEDKVKKKQIHPLSDWDIGYNQALSDVSSLLSAYKKGVNKKEI